MYVQALFDLLAANGYRLTESEVKVFMPGLVEKCGQPQPNVKADCRCVGSAGMVVSCACDSALLPVWVVPRRGGFKHNKRPLGMAPP